MKVVYFGTPAFSASVLEHLIHKGVDVVAVISRPDRPVGRRQQVQPVPVKLVAEAHGIPIYQPEKVSDPSFSTTLHSFGADLFVVVAYGEILKQPVLDTPLKGCINLHASLLPRYRGAAPIQRVLIDGATESGVTVMHMVKKMDAGAMIAKAKVAVPLEMTYGELEQELCKIGSELLLNVLQTSAHGLPKGEEQNESQVTFAPKIELEDCKLDWSKSAISQHNLVRGVNPEPGAWSEVLVGDEKKRLKIYKTYPWIDLKGASGEVSITSDKKILVGCSNGSLELLELQPEGKKRMRAIDYLQGLAGKSLRFIS